MESIRGVVYKTIYTNTQQTYCVFLLRDYNEELITVTGRFASPHDGEDVEVKGQYVVHPKYGRQFDGASVEKLKPDNIGAAKIYLLNLGVKGLGEKSVQRLIDFFGLDLLDILKDKDPKDILDVPQLRSSVKLELYNTLRGEGILSDLNAFFDSHHVSAKWSRAVYEYYGAASLDALERNPYVLLVVADDISFTHADTLAQSLGIAGDDERRLEAGLSWIMNHLDDHGHTCLPVDVLIEQLVDLLQGYADEIADYIERCMDTQQLWTTYYEDILYVYPPHLYAAETESVEKTQRLLAQPGRVLLDVDRFMADFQERETITLGKEQQAAIRNALDHHFHVITGGPGTGKTTIIKALVGAYQCGGLSRILLCAPTGRAAKRLTEATNWEATTIHRLLMPVPNSSDYDFTKNEDDPLEADVVIVDEASMLNVRLYHALLQAIPDEATVIIVGDVDQLPPIGAGFVLQDLLTNDGVSFTRLHHIYRQQEGNTIISNAYRINEGDMPILETSEDFHYVPVRSVQHMMHAIQDVYEREAQLVEDPLDIQIICPMRKGQAGSLAICQYIQDRMNPPSSMVAEVRANGITYRVNDKVIQVENNYDLEVFNGDVGIIYAITDKTVGIRFSHRDVMISLEELHMIMPAYAITVHKSQGSEYGTVIIPFIPVYANMLQRNLLYTAVTRAKHKVYIIGTQGAIERAIRTVQVQERYTLFSERLQGIDQ